MFYLDIPGGRSTDSSWLATVANEHGNRTEHANEESRRADHSDDYTNGIEDGALQQILKSARGCRILDDCIENDIQNDVTTPHA